MAKYHSRHVSRKSNIEVLQASRDLIATVITDGSLKNDKRVSLSERLEHPKTQQNLHIVAYCLKACFVYVQCVACKMAA